MGALTGSRPTGQAPSGLDASRFDPARLCGLARRCEAATGPDRELDRDMWLAVIADANQRELVSVGRAMHGDAEAEFRIDRMMDGCAYTESLDAALTLLPGTDWEWALEWESGSLLYHPDIDMYARAKIGDPTLRMAAECVTPALAMCAAALRARHISTQEQPQ